ncbi:MAG TPA: ABC transporter permease [Acidimicrobiales bacterium]|nr:ABC transporter permease [Acidimicrobiales bacterium]
MSDSTPPGPGPDGTPPSADGVDGSLHLSDQIDRERDESELSELAGQAPVPRIPAAKKDKLKRKARGIVFWLALGWIGVVVFVAVFANVLPFREPNDIFITDKLSTPGQNGYVLGTDGLGRDILSRLAFGARVSLIISLSAVGIGIVVGGTLGMMVGYFRGKFELGVMAAIDIILAFPGLILLLGMVAFVGQSLTAITMVVGFLSIPVYARVARGTTLAVAQREYVLAARAMGASNTRILFREIMPNVILPVAAFGLVALGIIIVLEGSLAFLGLSVQPPDATWGSMIAEGKRHLSRTTHVALMPSLVMFLTVLSVNFVGDSLRSRFDVKESSL